jgi:hypothetical protein
VRAAALLARAVGKNDDAAQYDAFAENLASQYDRAYGPDLVDKYGSYCVLWPCRLYPLAAGKAHEQFKGLGPQAPESWRYFPLARAHQSLLAGNRTAGYGTLDIHLDHPQMRHWYAFDEGGKSGSGGWGHLRTTWSGNVAMPHGWAVAEVHLLLRDCLAYEDGGQVVLFGGIPESWFKAPTGIRVRNFPTHFGSLDAAWEAAGRGATLRLDSRAAPPEGFLLALPDSLRPNVSIAGKSIEATKRGFLLPAGTRRARIQFGS